MEQIHFSIEIDAPKERVWDTMLRDETYRVWTSAFAEGSHYEGSWEEGSKILFLDPNNQGMVSRIKENRPYKFISIEHLGCIANGKEDLHSQEARAMAGALENYTFTEADGVTEVQVTMDTSEEYKSMFDDTWPKALRKLKEMAENNSTA